MKRIRMAAVLVLLIADAPGPAASGPTGDAPSVRRGETLVTTGGGGRTVRCALCHGEELRGLGQAPAIAGRAPRYLVRQLSDMQKGVRRGLRSDLMGPTVARLTADDITAIAAYVASQRP